MITDEMRVDVYKKDLDNCNKGESKGGYSLHELQEMAINYFDLAEDKAKAMPKPELCNHISRVIKKIKKMDIDDENKVTGVSREGGVNYIYPRDMAQCKETPNRGGMGSKELKVVAKENFGLDVEGKSKEEICDAIEGKLVDIRKKGRITERKQTLLRASKVNKLKYTFEGASDIDDDTKLDLLDEEIEDDEEDEIERNKESQAIKISKMDKNDDDEE
jgi:hypothetical protein